MMNPRSPPPTAALGALLLATVAGAAENGFPVFQTGMWSFTSTVNSGAGKPQVRSVRQCTNPTDDMKKKWNALAGTSCKFTPVTRTGDRYSYSSVCQNNGVLLRTKSTIVVVQDGNAYQVETESRTNSQTRRDLVVAQRVGDCAASVGSETHPTPK